MIDIKQCRLCAFKKYRASLRGRNIKEVSRIAYKRAKAFGQGRYLLKDFVRIQLLAAISLDDPVGVLEIAFNARAQDLRHQCISRAYAAASRFVFISGTNSAQRRTHFLVTKPLFACMVQGAMVGKYQMSARTNLHAFRRNFHTLRNQAIGFFKKRFWIDHHTVAQHAGLAAMDNSRRQQMQYERLVSHLDGMSGIVSTLIAGHYVEVFSQKVNDLAFAFVPPLRADDYDNFGHDKNRSWVFGLWSLDFAFRLKLAFCLTLNCKDLRSKTKVHLDR